MSEYRGFIALVPRPSAEQWIRNCAIRQAVPVLQAFASDTAWHVDQPTLPALGWRLELQVSGRTYIARQYTTRHNDTDMLAVACIYTNEWHAPGGKFAADVQLHRQSGTNLIGVRLIELMDGDLDGQVVQALSGT